MHNFVFHKMNSFATTGQTDISTLLICALTLPIEHIIFGFMSKCCCSDEDIQVILRESSKTSKNHLPRPPIHPPTTFAVCLRGKSTTLLRCR